MSEQMNTVVSLNSDIVRPDDGNTEQRPVNASSATNKASDGTCSSTSRSLSTDEAFKQLDGQLGETTGIRASDAMDLGLPSLAASSLPDNVDLVQGRIDRIKLDLDTLYGEVGSVAKSLIGEKSGETRAKIVARGHHLSQSIQRMIAVRDSLLSCMAALPVVSSSVDGVKPGRSLSYEPVIVPKDLPAFQWVGMDVFDPKSIVFPTIDGCLLRFQNIMFAYGLDFDKEYARLVPLSLCREQRDWYESFKSSYSPSSPASWNDFKDALKARYEASALIGRQNCACELINIQIMPHEKVEAFMNRFLGLRRQAADQAPQDFLLVQPFLNALPWDVRWRVDVVREIQGTNNNPNIDAIAFITREVLKITSGSELPVVGQVYKARYTKEATEKKACTFHKRKRHNHDTSECNKRLRKVKRQRQKKRAARSANTPATNNNPSDQEHHSTYLTYYL